jgi:hypothetical protein
MYDPYGVAHFQGVAQLSNSAAAKEPAFAQDFVTWLEFGAFNVKPRR